MTNKTSVELFELLDEIRTLSFSVATSGQHIQTETRRLHEAAESLQGVSTLQTTVEQKSTQLDEKIRAIKSLIDL